MKKITDENTNAKITCDFGDERFRIAVARLEKDIICEDSLAYGSYSSKDKKNRHRRQKKPPTLGVTSYIGNGAIPINIFFLTFQGL